MRKIVFAVLLFAIACTSRAQSTTNYSWAGYEKVAPAPSPYAINGQFADTETGLRLTVSLPQWYYPFGPNYEYPATSQNWTHGESCDATRTPYPSVTFETKAADGPVHSEQAQESTIRCTSTYNWGTNQLTTAGTFSGTDSAGRAFSGQFHITSYKGTYGSWSAQTVTWTVVE